jgi:hypothetical protein
MAHCDGAIAEKCQRYPAGFPSENERNVKRW